LKEYDPSVDLYYVCLEDLPRKVMWTAIFNSSYDFSIGFDNIKRIRVVFGMILVIATYLAFSKLLCQEFDELFCASTISDLMGHDLKL